MSEQANDVGSALEGVTIDRDAEVPIGVQLAWAVRARIGDGRLRSGQQLPGLREVAETIGVNVNTVRSVYQRLEHEGLVDSRQGTGTFVASTPGRPSAIATIAADAARVAHETGVEPREVAAALYVAPGPRARRKSGAAERRRRLREQITTLERTLGEMEAKHPGLAPPPEATDGVVGPSLLDTAQLEQVQTLLVRRLAAVQAAIDRLADEDLTHGAKRAPAPKAARSKPSAAQTRARPAPAGA